MEILLIKGNPPLPSFICVKLKRTTSLLFRKGVLEKKERKKERKKEKKRRKKSEIRKMMRTGHVVLEI